MTRRDGLAVAETGETAPVSALDTPRKVAPPRLAPACVYDADLATGLPTRVAAVPGHTGAARLVNGRDAACP